MTDFIHEHPKDEAPVAPPPPPAEEAPMDEKTGQKRVYGYIFILFIVAFSLLVWSFFMNQRSTDQVLSELRGNASTLQSTLDQNVALEQQNEALEQQIKALESQVKTLTEENESLQGQLHEMEITVGTAQEHRYEEEAAMQVYYAAVLASEERYREAAEKLTDWETTEFVNYLDSYDAMADHYAGENRQPEPVRPYYDTLVEQLTKLGYLTVGADGRLSVTEPAG